MVVPDHCKVSFLSPAKQSSKLSSESICTHMQVIHFPLELQKGDPIKGKEGDLQ